RTGNFPVVFTTTRSPFARSAAPMRRHVPVFPRLPSTCIRIGIDSRRSVWSFHSRYPRNPTTAHTPARPVTSGAHPQSAPSPPQLDGETNPEAIARITSGPQIRSRQAPEGPLELDSAGPISLLPSIETLGLWVFAELMSGTRNKGSWTFLDGNDVL